MASASSDKKFLGIIPAEAVPGALLVAVAVLAMMVVNSPLGGDYKAALSTLFTVGPTGGGIEMKVSDWIKSALMAVFFFFVGLELKREMMEGQLSTVKLALLPVLAAAGGMAAPALIYLFFASSAGFGNGWAIPAATDIAFALGVLSLLGSRVPPALKAFLLAVAVVDDLGAILIVAFFYTTGVEAQYLWYSGIVMAALVALNVLRVGAVSVYVAIGIVLWVFMQKSGVSPTLAGVLVAACVPLKDRHGTSPLHAAEHDLRPWVLFGVMPIFAFANAGVDLQGAGQYLTHPITLGIAFGLTLGKPIGIGVLTFVGAKLLKAPMPGNVLQLVGVGFIAGIGFTMSLFVGSLAFSDPALQTPVRLGVYAGSLTSAALGLALLAMSLPKKLPASVEAAAADETRPFILPEAEQEAHNRSRP